MDDQTATTAAPHRVSVPAKVGYGFGAIGGQIFRDTPALILPIYMITVLGIPAWMAGLAILIPKAWIIFCDPLVGAWSDRRSRSWGRAPFLLAGGILSGFTFVLMFSAPDFESPWASAIYMTFSFALASTAYSLFSVPYLSVAAEMSDDPAERTRILAIRVMFLAVGVAVGAGYALPVAQYFGAGWTGFNRMGTLYGAVCMVAMLVTFFTVRRTKMVPSDEPRGASGKEDLRALWANKPFVTLATAYFIALTAQGMTYTVFGLFFVYVMKDPSQLALVNIFAALSVLVGQPVTVWLNRYLSKKTLFAVGIIGWAALCVSWAFAGPQEAAWINAHTGIPVSETVLLALRGFLWGMFNSVYLLMALSLLTDTIAYDRDQSGISRSGLFSGVFSALEKVAFALGPAVCGLLLSAGGFIGTKSGDATPQSAAAITTLILCFCIYPAVIKLASLLIFWHYKERL
ncbi:MFS transporter [Sphingobium boeckii]|uniref:GPH family glycoside/pentoside/hexuronide:cation symporter n=1 Tax=Sphingobium boeckii TaxID=1082345 RepID=A0A7W9AGN7_9SPHN|nr:MFS transporter [Sphingobium boeckii]MBB5685345.1 GPH family glycoside/pentoside/hexuronide:cation symporter [Sphingobium boeckii]